MKNIVLNTSLRSEMPMPRRVQIVELRISHVRKPRHRVPVAHECRRKGPSNDLAREPHPDVGIAGYIFWVVIVDEFMAYGRPIHTNRREQEQCDNIIFRLIGPHGVSVVMHA